MEKYLFKMSDGTKEYREVIDKIEFFNLLKQLKHFKYLYKYNEIDEKWEEIRE